jgi:cytochrome subunit of sulfide dehydrogenase
MRRGDQAARCLGWALAGLSIGLSGCGGGGGEDVSAPERAEAPALQEAGLTQPSNTTGRLLASNCFQCHGTGGMGGLEKIRGGEVREVREYRDLLRQPANQDIMAAHAQGYTDAQIAAIIQYLQQ